MNEKMSEERLAELRRDVMSQVASAGGSTRNSSAYTEMLDEIDRLLAENERLARRDAALSEVVRVWLVDVQEYDQNWYQCSCLWLPDRDWDPIHRCASVDGAFLIGLDPKGEPDVDAGLRGEPEPCRCSPGDQCSCPYDCDCRERYEHVFEDHPTDTVLDGWRNTGRALNPEPAP